MRPLEVAVVLGLTLSVVQLLSPLRYQWIWIWLVVFVTLLIVVAHFAFEGYRWQMFPAYGFAIILITHVYCGRYLGHSSSYVVGVVGLILISVATLFSSALPVFVLPAPTGPYPVGTQLLHLIDAKRKDPFAKSGGPRELMIQIWYPAGTLNGAKMAPYREAETTSLWNARYSLARSHSYSNVPLSRSQERYPVLVFAPSWLGQRTEDTFLSEDLASHGYIVVGIDHPYSSTITAFPGGRIVRSRLVATEDYSSESAFQTFVVAAEEEVRIRTEDARFVLDSLQELNFQESRHFLSGRIDLDRVGIFGFSIGLGVAAETCWLDRRFKAGLGLDGMITNEAAKHGTFAPFLFMFGNDVPLLQMSNTDVNSPEGRQSAFDSNQHMVIRRSLERYGGYWMVVPHTEHMSFSDGPFYSPPRNLIPWGNLDAERRALIIRRYTLAFFDRHLDRRDQSLLGGPSRDFPEVAFEAIEKKEKNKGE
jgi:dienelactone hydrolase